MSAPDQGPEPAGTRNHAVLRSSWPSSDVGMVTGTPPLWERPKPYSVCEAPYGHETSTFLHQYLHQIKILSILELGTKQFLGHLEPVLPQGS